MTITAKAIKTFGFENPIAIAIAALEEQGKIDIAELLFEECKELFNPHWCDDADDLALDEEWGDDGNLEEDLDPLGMLLR